MRETDILGERTDVHVFHDWCWLGTAHDDVALRVLVEALPRGEFELDIYRVLVKKLLRMKSTPVGQ